jgi:hypothetical protein
MRMACVSITTSDGRRARQERPPPGRGPAVAALLVALVVLPAAVGRARAADGSTKGQAAGPEKAEKADKGDKGDKSAKGEKADKSEKGAKSDKKPPACMHCGATCGLEPICVCKPGTKKKPVTEYATDCEPFCVPGCSGPPWCRHGAGCTDCPDDSCRCPGRVRSRKKLSKETRDEEVAVVKRSVAYVCCRCAEQPAAGCCETDPAPRAEVREPWWTGWWSRCLR